MKPAFCKYCRFWSKNTDNNGKFTGFGECRRFPPTLNQNDDNEYPVGIFPSIVFNSSCGEFKEGVMPNERKKRKI